MHFDGEVRKLVLNFYAKVGTFGAVYHDVYTSGFVCGDETFLLPMPGRPAALILIFIGFGSLDSFFVSELVLGIAALQ